MGQFYSWRNAKRVIKCCKDCVAPKRHPGCHDTCEDYKKEIAEYKANEQRKKEFIKNNPYITNYDFNKFQ